MLDAAQLRKHAGDGFDSRHSLDLASTWIQELSREEETEHDERVEWKQKSNPTENNSAFVPAKQPELEGCGRKDHDFVVRYNYFETENLSHGEDHSTTHLHSQGPQANILGNGTGPTTESLETVVYIHDRGLEVAAAGTEDDSRQQKESLAFSFNSTPRAMTHKDTVEFPTMRSEEQRKFLFPEGRRSEASKENIHLSLSQQDYSTSANSAESSPSGTDPLGFPTLSQIFDNASSMGFTWENVGNAMEEIQFKTWDAAPDQTDSDKGAGKQSLSACGIGDDTAEHRTVPGNNSITSPPEVQDWDYYRKPLMDLYLGQRRTIREVMNIMKLEYGFSAP